MNEMHMQVLKRAMDNEDIDKILIVDWRLTALTIHKPPLGDTGYKLRFTRDDVMCTLFPDRIDLHPDGAIMCYNQNKCVACITIEDVKLIQGFSGIDILMQWGTERRSI